ncbi:MAG: Dam family site-specific DNA-(adenine-N6)-methyltransferase [Anaerolineales bacterium]|nr:Dam family site-specific DNA-(adenine-N6)-methyltransferase [Anaerolineales bacterium]
MAIVAISDPPMLPVQPFLRWAGSKRQVVPVLSRYWDGKYSRYVEPFVGSASLFFYLSPSRALLGDINAELIATYDQVKQNLPSLLMELKNIRKGRRNYLRIRALDPSGLTPSFRAARFIYLNRYCFNGLYRTNQAGQFNVPYGDNKSGKIPSDTTFERNSLCLQKAQLVIGSFEYTLEKVQTGDFVYMDPPFKVKAKRVFNQYDSSAFDQVALQRLREWLIRLNKMKIPFLVSYAESDEAYFLAQEFHVESVSVRRNISGFVESRRNATELLISNRRPY